MATFHDTWRAGGTGRGAYILTPRTTTEVPLTITGIAAQTSNYLLVQSSASVAIFTIASNGNITIANDLTVQGSTNISIDEAITGNLVLTGNLTVNGNSIIGNAAADTLTIAATTTFSSTIVSTSTATFSGFVSMANATLPRRGSTPATLGSTGRVYTFAGDADTTELWYLDAAGNAVQITDAGAIDGASVHWDDDEAATFGNTAAAPNAQLVWDTTDANANHFKLQLPTGDATDVPVLSLGDTGIVGVDLGILNGITVPTLAIWSAADTLPAQYTNVGIAYAAVGVVFSRNTVSMIQLASGEVAINEGSADVDFRVESNDLTSALQIDGGFNTVGIGATATDNQFVTITERADTSGTPKGFTFVGAAHTGLTAATEVIGVDFDIDASKTWAAGAGPLAQQREVIFRAPTYVGDAGGALTITDAATVYISAGPIAGGNMTITRSHALQLADSARLSLGTTGDAMLVWDTTDANANHLKLQLPTGGGTDVPVLSISDTGIIGVDLGLFNGVTDPSIAILDIAGTDFLRMTHSGTHAFFLTNVGGFVFTADGTIHNIINHTAGTETVFNENSIDLDLRVESNNLTSALQIDGAFDTIGIGATATDNQFVTITERADTSGTPKGFTFTGAAHTGLTAATEVIGVDWDVDASKTWAAGAGPLAQQREVIFRAPTYVGDAGGALTITDAATVYITGAPIQGANMTLTRSHALQIASDAAFAIGTTGNAMFLWETADANANMLHLVLPTGSGTDVPVLAIGDASLLGDDLGAGGVNLAGTTRPTIAILSAAEATPALLTFDGIAYGAVGVVMSRNSVNFISFAAEGVVINEGSADVNIRVESDNLDNIFQIDAGFDTIGIGATATDNQFVTITERADTSGTPKGFTFTGAAHTGLTAATEVIGVDWDVDASKTWAAGAGPLALQREVIFRAPTYVGDAGGALTIVESATVAISGAPVEGTNITLASVYGLLIQAGAVGSPTNSYGMYVNTQTGATNNYAAQFAGGNVGILQAVSNSIVLNVGWNASTMAAGTTAARHFQVSGNITELSGAAITDIVGAYFNTFTITDGGGVETVDTVATVYIAGAPTVGSTPTNGPYSLFVDAGTTRLDAELLLNHTGAAAGTPINIDYARTAYTTAVGLIDVVRSGALTGADTESIIDLNIVPSFTLTEPGGGSVNLYGANIDLSGIAVTAGVGTSVLAALRLVANADADVGTNYALFVDAGTSRLDGVLQQNDAIYFTQTDGAEQIDSQADGYVDYTVGTGHRFRMSAADTDVRLEFIGTTSSGLLEWMEDEDYFRFSDHVFYTSGTTQAQGTDIASASTIAIPANGDTFELTGTTAVNLITTTGYQDGKEITLIANENVTVNHATATAGANVTILLNAAGNFAMTANDTLTLVLSSTTAGAQAWREKARAVI